MQQRTRHTARSRSDVPAFRAGWLRFVLALCTSFVAAGYFAAVSHMAFVAHARCAEHGQLVHAGEGAHGPAEEHAQRAATTSVIDGDALSSDEHDHCVLGVAQPDQGRVGQATFRLVPHDDPPVVAPLPAPRPARSLVPPAPPIAILLLSPKSSPPA